MDDSQSTGAGMLLAGRYRLTEAIGSGGMGRVWRAQDEVLHRTVAVKELTAGLYATEAERAVLNGRTRTEARAAARISHPNVVTVHDVLDHDDRPWIVMQYVDGRSLSDIVKESGRLDPREAARIGESVLGALRAAHAAGVLHRDVKPANVMLARDGRALLADFGIAAVEGDASVTRTGELIGSVEYLAPERVQGAAPGPASDLWSLGATLYTAVQGVSPYHRDSALATLQAVVTDEAPYPSAAGELGPVIVAMLRKDPAERPEAAQCALLLADVAAGRATGTFAHPTAGYTAPVSSYGTPRPAPYGGGAPGYGTASGTPPYGAPQGPQGYGQVPQQQGAYGYPGGLPTHQGAYGPQAGPTGPVPPAATGPAAQGPGGRRGSRRRAVALAVAAAVLIGGGIGYGVTQFGGSQGRADGGATVDPTHRGTGTGAGGGSSPSPGGGSPGKGASAGDGGGQGAGDAPAGWQRVDAPEGFSIWLPDGYVRVPGVKTIDYSPDGDQHFVRISIDTQPDFPTPLGHLKNLEGSGGKVGTLPDYHRITLDHDTYRDQKLAARWEFTWNQDAKQGPPGPRTAADLMYVDGDTGTEYAVYMSGPTADWDDARFATVLRGWQPPAHPGG
ncbi:serine/threonine-protein kinase [Streptomyces sp. NPDC047002]|uniref:serine/threonine-protein kinase n=1 Tax=Streptomyces sp. NPDC047002 TaxID=3155475 RepID=UPI003455705B